MTRLSLISFFILLSLSTVLIAQQKDAGMWVAGKVDFEGKGKRNFYFAPEVRMYDNMRLVRSAFTDLGVQQKLSKNWSTQAELRVGARSNAGLWNYRQRLTMGVQWKNDWGKLETSALVRQQWGQTQFGVGDWQDADLSQNTRLRAGLKYTGLPKVDLYTSHELFFNTSTQSYSNWRWQGGTDWDLKNHQGLKLGYLIQRDVASGDMDYVVTAGYSYAFELPKEKDLKVEKSFQQQVLLMNGRTINGEVMMDSTLMVKVRYQGKYGKTKEAELHRSEIFSVTTQGNEVLLYGQDSLLGYTYNVDEMRVFLMGERDAYNRYSARHAWMGGFLVCGTLAFLGQDGFLSAVAPPMLFALANIPFKVRCRSHHMSDEALKYNDWYAEGFGPVAKSKRIKRALIGGFVGSATGLLFYYATR
jgi:hypothetical protein